jgi:hypothetical protein
MTFGAHVEGDARIGGDLNNLCHNSLRIATSSPPYHRCHRTWQCGHFVCVTIANIKPKVAVVPALSWLVESVTPGNDHIRQGDRLKP